jgi:aldehyde:ferredoxin oxidoreductase
MVLEKRKIAYINLSKKEVETKTIPMELRRLYLGGRGLSAYLLYNHVPPKTDPLSPHNVVLVGTGLLGAVTLQSGRTQFMSKSPETGIVGDGNLGGFFGPELKFAGYEHLLIKGKAEKPVYLWIHDGQIEFMDATHLWGMTRPETIQTIRKDLGDPEIQIVCVGPAAENLVRFANVMTDYKNSARAGTGCVMGSKNLKAIAVRGTMAVEVKFPDKLYEYMIKLSDRITNMKWARALSRYGTPLMIGPNNEMGALRTLNAQLNMLPDAKSIEADALLENFGLKMLGCYACQIHCRHRHYIRSGPYAGTYGEGPEYVVIGQLGPIIGITDLAALLKLSDICNDLGIDISSFGTLSAWVTELFQRGIIDKKVTGGMELEWGNAEVFMELARKVAYREGFGDLLAEGGKIASQKIGKNSADYLIHVKWLPDSTTHDVRKLKGYALGIAVASRGADHLRSRPTLEMFSLPEDVLFEIYGGKVSRDQTSYEGKERMVWWTEHILAIPDSLGICKFICKGFNNTHGLDYPEYSNLIYYGTGLKISASEIEKIGERIINMERLFNNREAGISRKDDTLPKRCFDEPMPIGPAKGERIDREKFNQMLDRYYELRGWDKKTGLPTKETLERLNLANEPTHLL